MFEQFVIFLVAVVVGLLFAPKPPKPKAGTLDDVGVPKTEEGDEIPKLYGTYWIKSPQVAWYGHFRTKRMKTGGTWFTKPVTTGYRYFLGLHFVLCQAADALLAIKFQDKTAWQGERMDARISINKPKLFGGKEKGGGVKGSLDVEGGGPTQGRNAYLNARYSGLLSAHRGAVSVIANQIEIGESPQLKPIAFKTRNVFGTYDNWLPARAPINGEGDAIFGNAAIYIALDDSGSMGGTRFNNQQAAIRAFVESLKGTVNSVKIVYWATTVKAAIERFNCTTADYDAIISFIDSKSAPIGGTDFAAGVSLAAQYFADDAAAQGSSLSLSNLFGILDTEVTETRRKVVLFLTDGGTSTASAEAAVATLSTISDVEVFCFNIILTDISQTSLLDNTPQDGVPVIADGDAAAIQLALANAFSTWTDINPAHILRDLILSPTSGGSGNADEIGDSFTAAANLLFNEGFGLSLFQANPSSADEFKKLIETHIDAAVYFDRISGKWEIKLIRDDYDAGDLYTFDGSNITEWLDASLPSQFDLPNKITVKYTKREDGKQSALTRTNVAAVQALGRVIPDTVTYEGITADRLAAQVAQRDLLARTVPLHLGSFRATYVPNELNLGSAIIVNEPRMGIKNVICRITEIEDGDGRDNSVIIRYVEDKFALPEIVIEAEDDIDAPLTGEALPPSITFVEEESYFLAQARLGQAVLEAELGLDPDLGRFIATADRPNDQHIDIAIGRFDDPSWVAVGEADFAASGALISALTSAADDVTFTIPISDDLTNVQAGSLLRIGVEYLRVDDLAVDGDVVTVTAGRGCLDTVPAAHDAGAIAIFFAGETGSDDLTYTAADTIDIKLLPNTSTDTAAISSTITDTVTFASRAIRPYPVGKLQLEGSYAPATVLPEEATLTWLHRDRLTQTGAAVADHAGASIGPEADVVYTVTVSAIAGRANIFADADFFAAPELFWGARTELHSEAVAQLLTWDYDHALHGEPGADDLALEFALRTDRGIYENWQTPKVVGFPLLAPINLTAGNIAAGPAEPEPEPDPFPLTLSGIEHWYDVSDAASVTSNGTNISVISDKKGTAHLGNPDANKHPAVSTLNGLTCADFVQDGLFSDNLAPAFANEDQPFTVAMVVRFDTTSSIPFSMGDTQLGSTAPYMNWGRSSSRPLFESRDATGTQGNVVSGGGIVTGVPIVLVFSSDGINLTARINGVVSMTGTANVGAKTGMTRMAMGALGSITTTRAHDGLICELIACSAQAAGAELTDLETYLTQKWIP